MVTNKYNWKPGTVVICTNPKSNFYTKGKEYKVVSCGGEKGLMGDDDLFDSFKTLQSDFKIKEVKK